MQPKDIIESSVSGYITDSFEGISGNFTDIEIISVSDTNIVAKAKRYGRWWLLKGIPKDKAEDEGLLLRLRKEFEMMMSLQHPNVVAASSIENVEKLGQCIVMEYVEGITLKEWLKNKSALRERRRLAWEITQAVAYLHSVGIIHRDLKPANIIVTSNGENIKIIDFGLSDTDSHSVLKQPAGTVSYMSPEQRAAFLPDVKNDIYSLGVIFSEMDLGYGKIVKKCTCDITNRYPNVAALQDDIRKRNNLLFGTIMAVAVVAIIVSAALGVISYFNMKRT
ncbi:MAG: serine/threonine-protein kinase [Muribaculaceae bacterium]